MTISSDSWGEFYRQQVNQKPLVPESFVARVFLSQSPVRLLKDYHFTKKTALDIGCGNGRHMHFLSQLGFDVTGVEISQDKVKELQTQFPNCEVKQALSPYLPFPNETFDVVCAINAIYYLDTKEDTLVKNLREAARVLKQGGLITVSFVGDKHFILSNAEKHEDGSVTLKNDPLGFRNDTKLRPIWQQDSLKQLLAEAGLELYKCAELQDCCDSMYRHLHYVTAYKTQVGYESE